MPTPNAPELRTGPLRVELVAEHCGAVLDGALTQRGRFCRWVLIPGAGGDPWFWHRVVTELADRGRPAIAVDLPAADAKAGLPEYLAAALQAVGDRPGEFVVVGQSLGGFTAPLLCERLPVVELVLVNAMIPAPGETVGEWWGNTGQPAARRESDLREGRDPAVFDEAVYFLHDVPPEVLASGPGQQRDQSDAIFESVCPLEAWPAVPTRVVAGRDDRFFPVEFQRRVAGERLGLPLDELPGGHLIALSQPRLLTDYLEA